MTLKCVAYGLVGHKNVSLIDRKFGELQPQEKSTRSSDTSKTTSNQDRQHPNRFLINFGLLNGLFSMYSGVSNLVPSFNRLISKSLPLLF